MRERCNHFSRSATAALLLAALAGCGTLPPKSATGSTAPAGAAASTALGRIASASQPEGWPSGFRLLPQAGQAFEAREQSMARAERAIDAQYYFIAGDGSGLSFLQGLETAARRGVRVRLLVDDLHDAAIEPELARLARLPHFEIRLFNPFCCARASVATRFAGSLFDAPRLERRMHNKLLIVDGSVAIAGGRNMADAYFGRDEAEEFVDIDALMTGDIVRQLGGVFERYWHSDPVWPAQDILPPPAAPSIALLPLPVAPEVPATDVLGQRRVGAELALGRLALAGGRAYAFADSPSKALRDDEDYLQETSVLTRAREALLTARSEVVIATPYLIPRTRGLAMMASLRGQGVDLRILTNGPAANDSLLAYAAYAHYRHRMLRQGVELHELGAYGTGERAGPGLKRWGPLARLHAKTFVVDRQTVFIGSTNFDPRSSDKNTELGILVESASLAAQMVDVIDAYRGLGAMQVSLQDEPRAGLVQWLVDVLVLPIVPEDLL